MSTITKGSGNVFADIGLPDAEVHLAKAELVSKIGDLIGYNGLTQAEAAERMGMSQPDVSKMLRGLFRPISMEKLFDCLRALGQDVEIAVKPTARVEGSESGQFRVKVNVKGHSAAATGAALRAPRKGADFARKSAWAAGRLLEDTKASKAAKTAAASALPQSKTSVTSKKAASAGSNVMTDPKSSRDARSVASALTQKKR